MKCNRNNRLQSNSNRFENLKCNSNRWQCNINSNRLPVIDPIPGPDNITKIIYSSGPTHTGDPSTYLPNHSHSL